MKLRVLVKLLSPIAVLLLVSSHSLASPISLDFNRITNNNSENIASQLQAQVFNTADALSTFNRTIASNELLFTFANRAAIASNIAEVYFDDSGLFASQTTIINSLTGYTSFGGTSKNGKLPAGNGIFSATGGFGADVQPGPQKNGINDSADLLGIVIQLKSTTNFSDVANALMNNNLSIGLHVRSIGSKGGSDSFINNAFAPTAGTIPSVPLPHATWMFLSGLVGLIGFQRRKTKIAV